VRRRRGGLLVRAARELYEPPMSKTTPRCRRSVSAPRGRVVDTTLVRWMARLTPTERLAVLQNYVNLVNKVRRARQRH
jgi:hypothetical protein